LLMPYFTDISTVGKVRYGKFAFAISVLEAPNTHAPIGMAFVHGRTDDGLVVWRLTVRGAKVLGRFVVITGQFIEIGKRAEWPRYDLPRSTN
jgi:hypothetical protein